MIRVTVVVPCYNEQATIRNLLLAVYEQSFPRDQIEVIIADGKSTDHTVQEIIQFQKEFLDLNVRIVENPKRIIPAGLNEGIRAAQGEFIIRLDGHSAPSQDYIKRCITDLESGKGENVGGAWEIKPRNSTWQARSIAIAASHPLAAGDARYRIGGQSQAVDTVPFGAFRRTLVEEIGYYDENLLTNEDYELNTRIRKAGKIVWFNPEIRSTYFAPASFKGLARQYGRYGFWKAKMLKLHPEAIRWRQALPPLFVLSLLILGISGFFFTPIWVVLMLELACYLLALGGAGLVSCVKEKNFAFIIGIPFAIGTMHFAWGSSFLWSFINPKY
jgi:succinoglycan biosynthesis protein ExoA